MSLSVIQNFSNDDLIDSLGSCPRRKGTPEVVKTPSLKIIAKRFIQSRFNL